MRLSAADLRSRLGFDFRVIQALTSPALGPIRAYASAAELARKREVSVEAGEAGQAALYVVEYRFPILVAAGKRTDSASARFDLLAGGDYPYSAPAVQITSKPLPWSSHVYSPTGTVCLGDGWSNARGRMLAAQLIVHVMKLLNFDEPEPGHSGWNAAAVTHWRDVMKRQKLNPDLAYPILPVSITHGITDPNAGFAPVAPAAPEAGLFAPAAPAFAAVSPTVVASVGNDVGRKPSAFIPAADPGETSFRPIGVGR
ncbi:MAG: hypothetical protein HY898_27950 [Deltaproteobacteria bacterium]|nr:hypothetical protein [Deltaproteobacteria bacterium]